MKPQAKAAVAARRPRVRPGRRPQVTELGLVITQSPAAGTPVVRRAPRGVAVRAVSTGPTISPASATRPAPIWVPVAIIAGGAVLPLLLLVFLLLRRATGAAANGRELPWRPVTARRRPARCPARG